MNQVWTALSSTTISGYVDTSAHWNIGTDHDTDPSMGFSGNDKSDGFNLNVVQLSIERPLDESQWASGYKVDLLFGPDANTFGTLSDNAHGTGDFGIRQAYVGLRLPAGNGIDVKVGVFDTIIGYEVFNNGGNPNYTRSYGYTIEPTTHTGVLASYQVNEMVSLSAGVANTFGPSINERAHNSATRKAESYKSYMASVAFTAPESMGAMAGSTLYGGVVNGYNDGPTADQTSWYIGATIATPVEGLRVGAAYDYAGISDQPLSGSMYANATALYASFQATEKMTFHTRGEYATSTDGVLPATKVLALTGTVQYDLWQNVISRLEVRWDHQADGQGRNLGNNDRRNAYLVAANLIYQF
jgi:hypothetical protein